MNPIVKINKKKKFNHPKALCLNAKFKSFSRFELSPMIGEIYHFKVRIRLQKPTTYNRVSTVFMF